MIAAKPPEPHLVRGTASLNTQAVKLVAPLIVMKSAALVERIPAQMAAVDTANAANLALLQVAHHQVVAPAHLQVVLHHQVALHLAQEVAVESLHGIYAPQSQPKQHAKTYQGHHGRMVLKAETAAIMTNIYVI